MKIRYRNRIIVLTMACTLILSAFTGCSGDPVSDVNGTPDTIVYVTPVSSLNQSSPVLTSSAYTSPAITAGNTAAEISSPENTSSIYTPSHATERVSPSAAATEYVSPSDEVNTSVSTPDATSAIKTQAPATATAVVNITDDPYVIGDPEETIAVNTPQVTDAPTPSPTPAVPTAAPPTYTDDYYGLTGKHFSDYKYIKSGIDLYNIDLIIYEVVSADMDKPEQIRAIHEWMVKNICYDTSLMSRHVNSLLQTGKATCQGYAELFYVFMGELDIDCRLISGNAKGESHAWNCVRLDGEWYYIDVTWDDPLVGGHSDYRDGRNLRYTYFLRPESVFSLDHTPDSDLPSPSAGSDAYHDAALEKAEKELLGKLEDMIQSGEVENGFIIDGPENIDKTIDLIVDSLNIAAASGIEPFRFTIFYITGTGNSKELSQKVLTRLSDAGAHAYKSAVGCSVKIQEQELYGSMTGEVTVKG